MTTRRVLPTFIVLLYVLPTLSLSARADARVAGYVISAGQIVQALREGGLRVTADRIEILSSVRSRQPNASLRLIRAGEWQDGTLKAEIRCDERSACLPFYVLVHDATGVPDVVSRKPVCQAKSSLAVLKTHDVHVGDRAILIFEGNESRITVRVVCVQNGDRGQKIRVASRDRKHFYQAEIVEPGLLRGSF